MYLIVWRAMRPLPLPYGWGWRPKGAPALREGEDVVMSPKGEPEEKNKRPLMGTPEINGLLIK